MYVVGAAKLRGFWEKRPEAEAPLRALYALLSEGVWRTRAALRAGLGEGVKDDGEDIELTAGGARILLKVHCAAEVVLIERVTAEPVEGRKS